MDTKKRNMLKSGKKYFLRYVPAVLQQPLKRFCIWPLKRLIIFVKDIWLPVYRIEQSGLTVILIGHAACEPFGTKACDPYIIALLFSEYVEPIRVGVVLLWGLNWVMRRWERKADFIIFRHRKFRPGGEIARRMLMVPCHVAQIIDLPPPGADLQSAFRNSQTRQDLKRIRKTDFEYEIIQADPAQLHFFYHRMYRPFIQDRHREIAKIMPWEVFRQNYEKMELMLIRKDGCIVAGSLKSQINDSYTGYALGVLDADRELVKAGALVALWWFSIVEAHRRGCTTLDMQCARPFLKDGILAYKKKWGSRIVANNVDREFWFLPCGNRSPMQRFLEENPFICEQDGRLVSLIFLGSHTVLNDEDLSSYLKDCHYQGDRLSTCIVLLNSEWAARAEAIQHVLNDLPPPNHILDLSHGSLSELPALISRWLERIRETPAEFTELVYSQ